MLYKSVSDNSSNGVIKDVDAKTGTVTGYFSIFGNVDSDGDMIMPGAYKRTLQNNYHRLKHLNQHVSTQVLAGTKKGNLIVKEDAVGLYFESKINIGTSYGKDVMALYERGDLDEHSIGYEVVKHRKASSYNELIELKLWEGSTVTWGANENAKATGIKSMVQKLIGKDPMKYLADTIQDIKEGNVDPEDVEDVIKFTYKQLEQYILDAKSTQPVTEVTPDPQQQDVELLELSIKTTLSTLQLKQQWK